MENNERNLLNGLFVFCRYLGDKSTYLVQLEGDRIDESDKYVSSNSIKDKKLVLPTNLRKFLRDIVLITNDERIDYIVSEPNSLINSDQYSESYNEVIFYIYPKEKKLVLRTKSTYDRGGTYQKTFRTPDPLRDLLVENDSQFFKLNFWGAHNDYEFDYSYVESDNLYPGDVMNGIEGYQSNDYFYEMLVDFGSRDWYLGEGSYGTISVNRKVTKIDIKIVDNYVDWSKFKKTYVLD